MTKKYTLTTSEETVTENPEDIIRLMKLAGLTNAQPVAEEEVNEEVYEPTEANDELDLDDYSKKSPESISKQKKSLDKAPSKGDNPLEYSLDENEIYEAMMKEFKELEESHGYLSDCCGAPADDDMDENNQAMCSNCKDYSSFSPVEESVIKEDKSLTAGTIKKLQHLVNTQHDVYVPGDDTESEGDVFRMMGSPYTADAWLSDMKMIINDIFTREGSPVPPEVAKVYNDLEAYSKQTELQAKRRANTDKNASNDAIYGPENEDELYIRDNFAEQWYDAFYKVEDRLGLEYQEDFDESVEEIEEVIEESKPDFLDLDKDGDKEESMKKAAKDKKEKADESIKTENTMEQERLKELSGINEDESVWNQFKELHDKMDPESEDRIFFSLKNYPKHRFELHGDIDGKDTKSGKVNVGVFLASKEDDGDDFLQNMSISQDEIKANITGAGWVGSDPAKGELKGTAGDYKEFGDVMPEPRDADQDRLKKLSGM